MTIMTNHLFSRGRPSLARTRGPFRNRALSHARPDTAYEAIEERPFGGVLRLKRAGRERRSDEMPGPSRERPSVRDLAGIGHPTKSAQGGRGEEDVWRQEGLCGAG